MSIGFRRFSLPLAASLAFLLCSVSNAASGDDSTLAQTIKNDANFAKVLEMGKELVRSGFSAGEGYEEIWIRDLNTFIRLACEVHERDVVKDKLCVFFRLQGEDGNIIDGYLPTAQARHGYKYIQKDSVPEYRGHKNTVETDQETSLVQAVFQYVDVNQDTAFLQEIVDGKTILERMEMALNYLLAHRFSPEYGLIWGATTADWGDVQPEHEWGVVLDESSHRAIDIYDNAMFLIAVSHLISLSQDASRKEHWQTVQKQTMENVRRHLWDEQKSKFKPHIYLQASPFPAWFDESEVDFHGGTAVAIQAGVLTSKEIEQSLQTMNENAKRCGAASIGLTLYPPYPAGFFKNPSMRPYSYQNGGDWTWFGGRMILGLIDHGFVEDAYRELQPMTNRIIQNKGFHEWYDIYNKPQGSGAYRGAAGVLADSIHRLQQWASKQR